MNPQKGTKGTNKKADRFDPADLFVQWSVCFVLYVPFCG